VNTSSFGIVTVILLGPEQIDEVLLPLFRGLRFPNSRPSGGLGVSEQRQVDRAPAELARSNACHLAICLIVRIPADADQHSWVIAITIPA
jgi:hypothetical protein